MKKSDEVVGNSSLPSEVSCTPADAADPLRVALLEIAEQELVEIALDPDWPRRIAKAALVSGKSDA